VPIQLECSLVLALTPALDSLQKRVPSHHFLLAQVFEYETEEMHRTRISEADSHSIKFRHKDRIKHKIQAG
jgi:hypothetical protein